MAGKLLSEIAVSLSAAKAKQFELQQLPGSRF
jgi:hypothetical protein